MKGFFDVIGDKRIVFIMWLFSCILIAFTFIDQGEYHSGPLKLLNYLTIPFGAIVFINYNFGIHKGKMMLLKAIFSLFLFSIIYYVGHNNDIMAIILSPIEFLSAAFFSAAAVLCIINRKEDLVPASLYRFKSFLD